MVRLRTIGFFLVGLAVVLIPLFIPALYVLAGLHLIAIGLTFLLAVALAYNKDFGGVALAAGLLGIAILIPVLMMSIGVGMLSG